MVLIGFPIVTLCTSDVFPGETNLLFREDFNTLDEWRPVIFPKTKNHSDYSIEQDKERSYLKAESNASASGIIYKKEFNVYAFPRVSWRWKITNVYRRGNAEEKPGDDYPIRIYIVFKYDPEEATFSQRIKYGLAKQIFGEYPPHSSLNYIWANRKHEKRILTNTYADEAKMIILQSGPEKAGQWIDERINIVEDYEAAFGANPPSDASIAIMNDSDNTGEKSTSYVDYIEVFR